MRRLLAWAIASLAVATSSSGLAGELKGDFVGMCDGTFEPREALRPSVLEGAVQPHVACKAFAGAYRALAQALERSLVPAERGMQRIAEFRRHLLRANAFQIADFQVNREPTDPTKEKILQSHADEIAIDCNDPVPQYLVDVAAVSLLAARVRAVQAKPQLADIAAAVARASVQAEGLLKDGLPMWPWELWLNGLRLSERDSDPLFRIQWVFMRPTAGIEVDTRNRAAADLNASVAIEPVGFVRYRGTDYAQWWGASMVVTSSTSRGLGIGGLLRWNNYVLGVTHHRAERRGEDGSAFVFVGVELHELISKKRAELKEWKGFQDWKSAREKLSN
jgi:hypothetical protein